MIEQCRLLEQNKNWKDLPVARNIERDGVTQDKTRSGFGRDLTKVWNR